MRDTGLAARLRAKAVPVVEVAGWQTRGNDGGSFPTFRPKGAIHHHTAGSSNGTAPSLNTCIYGRSDVPGPLCQVLQSREANHVDKAYVIASGKANHGGVGSWSGTAGTMDSNYESEGLEVEHVGTGSVHPARHETAARILAAMLEAPGSARHASMCCEHYEYALPAGRKIDFFNLLPPFDSPTKAAEFRTRVAYWIGRTTTRPVDPSNPFAPAVGPVQEDDDMAWYRRVTREGVGAIRVVTSEGAVAGFPNTTELAEYEAALVAAGYKREKGLVFKEEDEWNRYFANLTEEKVKEPALWLVQVTGRPTMYLTDWLQKRTVTQEDVGIAAWIARSTGVDISTKPDGSPHLLSADQADTLDRMEDTNPLS